MQSEICSGRAATIGTFDGVHLGHREVLEMLRREAARRGMEPIAFTFDRHPLELIAPERAPGNLMSVERKTQLIRHEGVTPVVLAFNEQLRSMRAYEWLDRIHRKYDVRLVVVGYDNTFGCDGINLSLADLKVMGETIGIEIMEAPEVPGVSSSRIRKAVKAGDMENAIAMLGHLPETEGKVVAGFHVGTDLGFPTANLQPDAGAIVPARGVYAARAYIGKETKWSPAMVNIGIRPTFDGTGVSSDHPTVEAHIIGTEEDLYGLHMRLEFVARLRDEQKFSSLSALRQQLEKDRENTMALCREA